MLVHSNNRMGGPLFYAPPSPDTCFSYSRIHGEEIYRRDYFTHWSQLNYTMANFTEEMHMPLSPQSDNSSSDSAYYKPSYTPYQESYYSMKTDIKPSPIFQDVKPSSEEAEEEEINVGESEALSETVICKWNACDRLFDTPDDLAHHVNVTHATSNLGGQYYCCWDDCPRARRGFNARYKMLVHVRTHTKEKPHQCSVCNKRFSRAENLKIHSRSHSGERPYVCPVLGCNKAYSNSSDRFKHTRTHATDRPYICKIPGCQKRYTDPSSLRKHVKTFKHQNLVETAEPIEVKHSSSPALILEIPNKIEPITDSRVSNRSPNMTDSSNEKELNNYKYKPSQNETNCNCSHKCLEHIEKATEFLKLGVILNNINNGNNIYDKTILNSNLKSIPWENIWNPLLTSDILKKVNDNTDHCGKLSNFDIKFKDSFNIEESMDIDVPLDLTVHK